MVRRPDRRRPGRFDSGDQRVPIVKGAMVAIGMESDLAGRRGIIRRIKEEQFERLGVL